MPFDRDKAYLACTKNHPVKLKGIAKIKKGNQHHLVSPQPILPVVHRKKGQKFTNISSVQQKRNDAVELTDRCNPR